MLTATCNALSFLKGHDVSRMVGGVHPDDGQSVSPLAPSPTGGWEGSEEDDGDDVLPASKRRPATPALTAARSSSGDKDVTSTTETIES